MQASDDLYLGPTGAGAFNTMATGAENPTNQAGCGPMGRIAFLNIVPATLATANVAVLQAQTAGTPLTLAAGAGTTSGSAPDGSGSTVIELDVARAVSLTSAGNLSAGTFTVAGFDIYGQAMSEELAGPNANTVNTTKAFKSVLTVTSDTTSATTVSVGNSDIFGLPFLVANAVDIVQAKWDSTLAANAGTFVAGDTTDPATVTTGDVRGTFAQAGNASNGVRRLLIAMHLGDDACGPNATRAGALGVDQA
jgi:hypothetical protein